VTGIFLANLLLLVSQLVAVIPERCASIESENLEVPRCAIAHLRFDPCGLPRGMTAEARAADYSIGNPV